MNRADSLEPYLRRLDQRLDSIDKKIDTLSRTRGKSLEWIAMLSEHIESLDDFREEVRATFEPFVRKLDNLDEVMRILRHATCDVARRVEALEKTHEANLVQ